MPGKKFAFLVFASAAVSCGTGGGSVKPDDMGAAQHREEAARESAAAREHSKEHHPDATVPSPFRPTASAGSGEYLFSPSVYNPTDVHLQRADEHRAHARQHEKAAEALERYEAAECFNFPPSTRAACPLLGPVTRIDDIAGGVRVTFVPGTRIDAVVAHMRCHYAYARARAFEETMSCPLYMRGIEIKPGRDPMTIEITAGTAEQVQDLRARSREEAVYTRRNGK
jgi:hypothetical protein